MDHTVLVYDNQGNDSSIERLCFTIEQTLISECFELLDRYDARSVGRYKTVICALQNEKIRIFQSIHHFHTSTRANRAGYVLAPYGKPYQEGHDQYTLEEQARCLLTCELRLRAQMVAVEDVQRFLAGGPLKEKQRFLTNTDDVAAYFESIFAFNFTKAPDTLPVEEFILDHLIAFHNMYSDVIYQFVSDIEVVDWYCECEKGSLHDRKRHNVVYLIFLKKYGRRLDVDQDGDIHGRAWQYYSRIKYHLKQFWLDTIKNNTKGKRYLKYSEYALRARKKIVRQLKHAAEYGSTFKRMPSSPTRNRCFFCRQNKYQCEINPATQRYASSKTSIDRGTFNSFLYDYLYKMELDEDNEWTEEHNVDMKWLVKHVHHYINGISTDCNHYTNTLQALNRLRNINTLSSLIRQVNAGADTSNNCALQKLIKQCRDARRDVENKSNPVHILTARGTREMHYCCLDGCTTADELVFFKQLCSTLTPRNLLWEYASPFLKTDAQRMRSFEIDTCIYLSVIYGHLNTHSMNIFLDRCIENQDASVWKHFTHQIHKDKLIILQKIKYVSEQMSYAVLNAVDTFIEDPPVSGERRAKNDTDTDTGSVRSSQGLYKYVLGLQMSLYYYDSVLNHHQVVTCNEFILNGKQSKFFNRLYDYGLDVDPRDDDVIFELAQGVRDTILYKATTCRLNEQELHHVLEPLSQMHMTSFLKHPLVRHSFYFIEYLAGLDIDVCTANLLYTIPAYALVRKDSVFKDVLKLLGHPEWWGESIYLCIYLVYYNKMLTEGYSFRELKLIHAGDSTNASTVDFLRHGTDSKCKNAYLHRSDNTDDGTEMSDNSKKDANKLFCGNKTPPADYKDANYNAHAVIVGFGKYYVVPNIVCTKNTQKYHLWYNTVIECKTCEDIILTCAIMDTITRDYSLVQQKMNLNNSTLNRIITMNRVFSENAFDCEVDGISS